MWKRRFFIATLVIAALIFVSFSNLIAVAPSAPSDAPRSPFTPTAQLVKDILTTTNKRASSNPSDFIVIGVVFYFHACDNVYGCELWRSDGTTTGTMIVKDIFTGTTSSNPSNLFEFNGMLFFAATDGINGNELWRSDGTPTGTIMVKDINAGEGDSAPSNFKKVGNRLFFVGNQSETGQELWQSDGTTIGTIIVKDINVGIASSNPSYLTAISDTLYFVATDGIHGNELWRSDGTSNGTVLVKDINAGLADSRPIGLINFINTIFFSANDGVHGYELWKSDGTDVGTTLVKDIFEGAGSSAPSRLTLFKGQLFFATNNRFSEYYGNELWKTDGSLTGTVWVKDFHSILNAYSTFEGPFVAISDTLFFVASDGLWGSGGIGYELWKSDGTYTGTMLLKDICPGSCPGAGGYGSLGYPYRDNSLINLKRVVT